MNITIEPNPNLLIEKCDAEIGYHRRELDKLEIKILDPDYDSNTIKTILMPIHIRGLNQWNANKKYLQELK